MAENKKIMEKGITKDMKITELVQNYPECAEVFFRHGLHCIGCAAAHFESLEQGCEAHGIDVDKIVKDLNECIEKSGQKEEESKDKKPEKSRKKIKQ